MRKMITTMIMVSLTGSKKPKLLYISSTQSPKTLKGNPFLYFQFKDFRAFQLFKFQWHQISNLEQRFRVVVNRVNAFQKHYSYKDYTNLF